MQKHQKLSNKTKLAVAGIATLGLVGGTLAPVVTSAVSAHRGNDDNKSQGWGGWRNSSDPTLVVEAVEAYFAGPHVLNDDPTPQPPVDTDTLRVTKLVVMGDFAAGMVKMPAAENPKAPEAPEARTTIASDRFYAHKVDGVWEVVFVGSTTPPQETLNKLQVPKELNAENLKF